MLSGLLTSKDGSPRYTIHMLEDWCTDENAENDHENAKDRSYQNNMNINVNDVNNHDNVKRIII